MHLHNIIYITVIAVFLWVAFMLQESGANGCEESGGKVVRNGIGEFVACIDG